MSEAPAIDREEGSADLETTEDSALPSGVSVQVVVPQALDKVWPIVKEWLRSSQMSSEFTRRFQSIGDIKERIACGEYRLWLISIDNKAVAAVCTVITPEVRCKVADIALAGGADVKLWAPEFYKQFFDHALENDCAFMRVEGRDGWARVLKDYGFEKAYTVAMARL